MARNMFSYSIIVTAREALPSHLSPDVNSLAELEKVLRVRLQTGAPGPSGQVDPDGVGILPWQTCVYAAGETPVEALKFIHFILSHKVHHGILPTMPELSVDVIGGNLRNLPEPWVLNETAVVDPAPKPFSVVPARGKRHVLAQLEQKAIEGEGSQAQEEEQDDEEQQGGSCYVFSVFGGIYPFRARFNENSIAGAPCEAWCRRRWWEGVFEICRVPGLGRRPRQAQSRLGELPCRPAGLSCEHGQPK